MKKITTIWLFVLLGLASIVSAEPPKADGQKWVETIPVLMNDETEMSSASLAEQNKVDTPKVWFGFGQWGNEKYQVNFFAEEVNQEYTVYFGVYDPIAEGWGFVSQIDPQFTTTLFNSGGFEAVDRKEVEGGTYISRPGVYPLEVRIYINGTPWYFLYQKTIDIPVFEVWLSSVCSDGSGSVALTFWGRSFPGVDVGSTLRVAFPSYGGVYFDLPVVDGTAIFSLGLDIYTEYLLGKTIETEFSVLSGGQVLSYSNALYYGVPAGDCEIPVPVAQ